MIRSLALVTLAISLVGCTRFSANPAGGPFMRKPRTLPDPYSPIPPAPPATNSPLALGTPTTPGAEVIPAGGVIDPGEQVLPKRRPAPKGNQPPREIPKDAPAIASPKNAKENLAAIKRLVESAAAKWRTVDGFEATVTRRELAPNKKMTEDVVKYRFRKEPFAVYIKNIGESGKGREILYFPSKHEDKIYSIIGKGDENFLLKAGERAPAVSPDMPLVRSKTRYSIREAGLGRPISRLGEWVAKAESGKIPAENLTDLGDVKRKEFPYPLRGVQLSLRPGDDPLMPQGGTRLWFFDPKRESPSCSLPVLVIAAEPGGREVEYYLFEKMDFTRKLTDADFDPARLGK
jgi:uncharacterized protein DUF1571